MIKKLFIAVFLLAILLSACNGKATVEPASPTVTVTATQSATATEASATETMTATSTVTATPETPIPTNPPKCTNSASFVIDVTYPDNSPIAAVTAFTKIWRIKNIGTCVWNPDYKLIFYSEERMGAPDAIPLPVTYPDQTVDLSVALVSPGTPGTYRGNFVIKTPAGLIMKIDNDSRLWVIINVTSAATSAVTATQGAGGATAAASVTPGGPSPTPTPTGSASAACAFTLDPVNVADAINAINAYRAQNNLGAYNVNAQLTQAAQAHAQDMACNQLFGHTGSDGSTPQTRVAATGYVASSVTENVYGSYPPLTGQGAVNWWINDKTDIRHSQNLLSTTYVDIGVAYAFYNNYGYYVVVFAKP